MPYMVVLLQADRSMKSICELLARADVCMYVCMYVCVYVCIYEICELLARACV